MFFFCGNVWSRRMWFFFHQLIFVAPIFNELSCHLGWRYLVNLNTIPAPSSIETGSVTSTKIAMLGRNTGSTKTNRNNIKIAVVERKTPFPKTRCLVSVSSFHVSFELGFGGYILTTHYSFGRFRLGWLVFQLLVKCLICSVEVLKRFFRLWGIILPCGYVGNILAHYIYIGVLINQSL